MDAEHIGDTVQKKQSFLNRIDIDKLCTDDFEIDISDSQTRLLKKKKLKEALIKSGAQIAQELRNH